MKDIVEIHGQFLDTNFEPVFEAKRPEKPAIQPDKAIYTEKELQDIIERKLRQ